MTRVEVNLDAVGDNIQAIISCLGNSTLMAVVKADAYGHGAVQVARVALEHGARALAVFTPDEGINLRRHNIQGSILVLGTPTKGELPALLEYELTPTVWDLQVARELASLSSERRIAVQVKIDTGLNRAGVPAERAVAFMRALRELGSLEVQGVFTHFASADESDSAATHRQLTLYRKVIEELARERLPVGLRHSANSAATLSLPASHLDLVRCGIAIYGYNPCQSERSDISLTPALSWLSSITRVVEIPAGAGVGYGHEFRADRPSKIALVPVGYGDGFKRSLGLGRGRVLVRGEWTPVVGRVSMDQITLDVSHLRDATVGDEVVIIGRQGIRMQDAAQLAAQAGTISYEVLCGIMPRVPRLYVRNGCLLA